MSDQKTLGILDDLIDAFNNHDSRELAKLHSENATLYMAVTSPVLQGREQISEFFEGIFTGWPDCRWEQRRVLGHDDLLCMEWKFTGSSIKYPGRPIETWDCGVFEVEDGKIVESRLYYDTGSIAKQREQQGI